MLLGQGALAFSLWTGLAAPVSAMERALATAGA
jgi:shikimate 5-dehydrogenase